MTSRRKARFVMMAAAAAGVTGFGLAQDASAQLYWDINGTTDGAVNDGVTPGAAPGTWDTATSNWNTDATGGAGGTLGTWVDGSVAAFSAGTNATVPTSSITLTGTRTISGLDFQEGRVTLTGTAGVAVLALSADSTFNVAASPTQAEIFPRVDGAFRITKTGPGLLIISNNQASNYTGGVTFNQGGFQIFADRGLGAVPAVNNGVYELYFNGGSLIHGHPNPLQSITIASTRTIFVDTGGAIFDSTAVGSFIYTGGATIANPGEGINGSGTITKRGGNLLVLSGENTNYTGKWVIEGGGLTPNDPNTSDTNFGAVPATYTADSITLQSGGGLRMGGGATGGFIIQPNRGITLGTGGGTITGANGAGALTIDSKITGVGSLTSTLFNTNNAVGATTILNGANDYTGGTVMNAGTLTANGASGLGASTGTLAVNNTNNFTAGTNVVLNLSTTSPTTTGTLSGTIATPTTGTNTATINNGGQLFTVNQTADATYEGNIAGTGGFTLGSLSTNTLLLTNTPTYLGTTTVEAGRLEIRNGFKNGAALNVTGGVAAVPATTPDTFNPPATVPAGTNAAGSKVSSLSVSGSGQLDLNNNDMVIDHDGSLDIADIRDLIGSGYNFGGQDGPGIISSTAANTDPFTFTLGYADNASLPLPYGTTIGLGTLFAGFDPDDTAALIKFTWVGDVTLDGIFDFQDLSIFNGNYDAGATTGRVWTDGDLNYDGTIDFQDLSLFNGTYDPSKPSLPEPGALGALGLLALGLGRRRRRN